MKTLPQLSLAVAVSSGGNGYRNSAE